ncbi:MAG: hypothetical protein IJT58_00035 [Synergistaceae bacterium]|nr:hypothetical protein [Synergistaceae bacterium]
MRIANNLPALTAYRELNAANNALSKSIQSLSTGLRINSSADDAAGFAISEKMRSQISGLDTAIQSTQDGISLLQTAEGAISQTNSMLMRMRELAVQASNDSLTSQDRQFIQLEIDELRDQINRIADTTQFNKKRILDGSSGAMWSSSDLGVRATINKGLISVDEFGQKVNHEGNYRLVVEAEPGQGQVQKSHIFNLDVEEVITRTEYVTIGDSSAAQAIDDDTLEQTATKIEIESLSEGDSGTGWSYSNGQLTIEDDGIYWIAGTNQTLTDRNIIINQDVSASVCLSNVNIDKSRSNVSAFSLESGSSVELYLKDSNYLSSGNYHAGIDAPKGTTLSISSISGDGSTDGTLEVHAGYYGAGIGGNGINYSSSSASSSGAITISGGTIKAYGGDQAAGIGGSYRGGGEVTITGGYIEAYGGRQGAGIGSGHFAFANPDTIIKIAGGIIKAYGGRDSDYLNGAGIGGGCHSDSGTILIKEGLVQWLDKDKGMVDPNSYPVFAQRGSPNAGAVNTAQDIGHGTDSQGSTGTLTEAEDIGVAPATEAEIIQVTVHDVSTRPSSIRDIMKFHNSDGVFLVERPQNITITQGSGKSANVTLYPDDTIYDVAEKINTAISEGLGQKAYTDNHNNFCTIASGPDNTSESVYVKEDLYRSLYQRDSNGNLVLDENNNPIQIGREYAGKQLTYSTMLVRSAVPGKDGELYFSGDEDLLNALGLNTIQQSSESKFTASVYNAHTGQAVAKNVKATDSAFVSLIPPDIDISVDAMSGISSSWDETTKRFIWARKDNYEAMIHLKNNGIAFQTGANGGEDFMIDLGDMSCEALNLKGVNLLTRESASRSITLIDKAINKVSSQRAKIGAYENALENTMNNLKTTSLNITAAESRIRDADMAQEMMKFVKHQILNQSGTSMLAQANQMPNSVLSLYQQ